MFALSCYTFFIKHIMFNLLAYPVQWLVQRPGEVGWIIHINYCWRFTSLSPHNAVMRQWSKSLAVAYYRVISQPAPVCPGESRCWLAPWTFQASVAWLCGSRCPIQLLVPAQAPEQGAGRSQHRDSRRRSRLERLLTSACNGPRQDRRLSGVWWSTWL